MSLPVAVQKHFGTILSECKLVNRMLLPTIGNVEIIQNIEMTEMICKLELNRYSIAKNCSEWTE